MRSSWLITRNTCIFTSIAILFFLCIFGIIFRSTTPYLTIIVIPGGGLSSDGTIPLHTQLRLDRANEIYRLTTSNNFLFITLSAGTTHKPNPIDKYGYPIYESVAASIRLIEMGIPPDIILEESFSLDTLGNAYFLRTVHIDQIDKIKKIVVITNKWHIDRVKAMFDYVFSLPEQHNLAVHKKVYKLFYEAVADGLDDEVLLARRSREAESLKQFVTNTKLQFASMIALHGWMYSKHKAYSASRHKEPRNGSDVDAAVLKSY
jgi:uncharacterized SAM-binding protein YcdF (DUF218 family)